MNNPSLAVFLINKDVRLIEVEYEPGNAKGPSPYNGFFTRFKTIDPAIKEGSHVIVETGTRHGYTVAKVSKVDLRVNYTDPTEVRWAMAVDIPEFLRIKGVEEKAIDAIQKAEERRAREQLAKDMLADAPELLDNELFNRVNVRALAGETPPAPSEAPPFGQPDVSHYAMPRRNPATAKPFDDAPDEFPPAADDIPF